jgi:hypothetical protein
MINEGGNWTEVVWLRVSPPTRGEAKGFTGLHLRGWQDEVQAERLRTQSVKRGRNPIWGVQRYVPCEAGISAWNSTVLKL